MNENIGPVVYSDDNGEVFLGKDYGHVNNYSEQTSAKIDTEIEAMMREAYKKTEKILTEHFDKLELVANTLIEKEKINAEEFSSLMENGSLPSNDTQGASSDNGEVVEKEETPNADELINMFSNSESTDKNEENE